MNDKATILSSIKHAVMEVDSSAEVILFGSQARGDAHSESDWDVIILTDQEVTPLLKQRFREKILDLQIDENVSIDALVRSKEYWQRHSFIPLYREVQKEGIRF